MAAAKGSGGGGAGSPKQDTIQKQTAKNDKIYEDAIKAGEAEAADIKKMRAARVARQSRPYIGMGKQEPRKYSGKTEKRYIRSAMKLAGLKNIQPAGTECEVSVEDVAERPHLFFPKGYSPE